MNGWLCFGYWLIVYLGLKFLDARTYQVNGDYFPPSLVAIINVLIFGFMVESGIPFLGAIPLTSLTVMSLCKLTSSQFVRSIWLSSFYLTLWIYLILALFYLLSFFAILLAGAGGFGSPDDRYYY